MGLREGSPQSSQARAIICGSPHAFADPNRVIAEDLSHSHGEKRYDRFGNVGDGILTVRFIPVAPESEPATGEEESESMSSKIKYTDETIGPLKVVPDFLPAPEELAFKEDTIKVTITLSKESVEFFKQEAKKHHTQYQKMIRRLLDITMTHKQPPAGQSGRPRSEDEQAV
jgi:predicted DNA binding CopG/RHH family protein